MRAEQQVAIVQMARGFEVDFQTQIARHRDAEKAAMVDARKAATEVARLRVDLKDAHAQLVALSVRLSFAEKGARAQPEFDAVTRAERARTSAGWAHAACGMSELAKTLGGFAITIAELDALADAQAEGHWAEQQARSARDSELRLAELAAEQHAHAERNLAAVRAAFESQLREARHGHERQLLLVEARVHAVVGAKSRRVRELEAELARFGEIV
ncbi:hypothetical protein T492DRAFT_890625 [Pavlovales sp. CCMP2436]|nr:hypothetical protein T492DRAFT_890625 [Pavlovales sp. CCMP2436]